MTITMHAMLAKPSRFLAGAALVLPALPALPARAGGPILELVPAESRWMVHVDVEGFQRSVLWQTLKTGEFGAELESELAEARTELGFDPLTLVRSATVFGDTQEHEEGVAVLTVSPDIEGLLDKLAEKGGLSTETHGGRTLHVWQENDDEGVFAYVHRFEGVANRLVYLSDSRERLQAALEVLEGRRPDVTQVAEPRLRVNVGADTFLYVETSEQIPGLDEIEPVSAIAAMAKGLRLEVGESAGALFAQLTVTAGNANDASKMAAVLQGAMSLLQLVVPPEVPDELKDLIESLRVSQNGNVVGLEFRHDSRSLIELLKELEHD
jgi:hypothetical protein